MKTKCLKIHESVYAWYIQQKIANSVKALQRSCQFCQFVLKISYQFCPNCGEPFTEFATLENLDEERLIHYYFRCGFTYRSIVAILKKRHNLLISHSTLKLRLKQFNLRRRGVAYDEEIVHQRISQLLDGPGCMAGMAGYRSA